DVAHAQAVVLEGFRFADAGAGDLLPGGLAPAGKPGGVGQEIGRGQAAGGELDDALAAADLQAEPPTRLGLVRLEMADYSRGDTVQGGDVVAGYRPHALPPLPDILLDHGLAGLGHPGIAPAWVPG